MIKGFVSIIRLILEKEEKDVVFLTHSNFQRFSLKGLKFDPYCYPVVEELNDIGLSSSIYQVGVLEESRSNYIKTINIENTMIFWYFLIAPFVTIYTKIKTLIFYKNGLSYKVNKSLEALNFTFRVPGDSFFIERASRLSVKSWFFEFLISKHKAKYGVLVGYGTQSGLAFNLACNRKKIKSIELQHGMVSPSLPRYYGWNNVPDDGYEFLPDLFWCWNKSELSSVYKWTYKTNKHNVLHEGNIYLKKREKYASQQARKLSAHFKYTTKSYNKICLVALQAPNVEPDWLLKAILASPRSILWLFKFHPADMIKAQRFEKINNLFKQNNLDNFDLDFANDSSLNIYDCIDVADVVVSAFSSSLLEALMLGKIPVVIHSEGLVHYSNYIQSGEMLFHSNPDEFLEYFASPESDKKNEINKSINNDHLIQSMMKEIFNKDSVLG